MAIFILKIMSRLYPDRVLERYEIEEIDFSNLELTFRTIAQKRGAIQKKEEVDYHKVYQIILQDMKNGAFGKITLDRLEDLEK